MNADLFGPECTEGSAVAIGAFDGLHLGHRHILRSTVDYAKAAGIESAAVIFDPLPAEFFGRIRNDQRILLRSEQVEMLKQLGIGRTVVLPFTDEIAATEPEDFLRAMQARLHGKKLFMGEDFSIGKNRSGNPEKLSELGTAMGYTAEIIPKDVMDGSVISSTRIRSLLCDGRIPEANRLLGYPFFFSGGIIHGEARGRKLGFPTLNVRIPEGKLKLPNGVYAVNTVVGGIRHASVTNIGVRPTFGSDHRGILAESFMFNTKGDFYGETVRLEFIEMLREEIRFASGEDLRAQIGRDIERAKEILSAC